MIKKYRSKILIISLFLYIILPSYYPVFAIAKEYKINQLIRQMKKFNGYNVEIKGEIVGDIMKRKNGTWLNIDDGSESIGVWYQKHNLPRIDFIGDYKSKGDILLISGIFNSACSVHGGETDIHAMEIIKVKKGHPIHHPISPEKIKWTLILIAFSIATIGIYWWRK
ncbi:MAG: hypothetical protein ACMUIU_06375 [bacterium]